MAVICSSTPELEEADKVLPTPARIPASLYILCKGPEFPFLISLAERRIALLAAQLTDPQASNRFPGDRKISVFGVYRTLVN